MNSTTSMAQAHSACVNVLLPSSWSKFDIFSLALSMVSTFSMSLTEANIIREITSIYAKCTEKIVAWPARTAASPRDAMPRLFWPRIPHRTALGNAANWMQNKVRTLHEIKLLSQTSASASMAGRGWWVHAAKNSCSAGSMPSGLSLKTSFRSRTERMAFLDGSMSIKRMTAVVHTPRGLNGRRSAARRARISPVPIEVHVKWMYQ